MLTASTRSEAEEVVRFDLTSAGVNYQIDVTLFNELTPLTVSNFLNYVDDGDYVKSFIHRSATNFVLQGGGFSFDSSLGSFTYLTGGLQLVPTDPPVVNEFKLSNIRGTLAMAKMGADPNSATSQWFFNLIDNSVALNVQNEGFTVFGETLGDGMVSVDTLASVPHFDVTAAYPDFDTLPLNDRTNITSSEAVTEANLIMLNSVTRLFHIDTLVDFGPPDPGVPVVKNFSITNNDIIDLNIASIDTSSIAAEFTVDASACENTTLTASQSCTMTATLTPGSNPYYSANISASITNLDHVFAINLTTPAPNLRPSYTLIDFGEQQIYNPEISIESEQIVLFINNIGDQDLEISSVTMAGAMPQAITVVDNCTTFSPLAPGEYCVLPINFEPLLTGIINAELIITSNDPDTPILTIPITGVSNDDLDGVSASIEDNAPNNGDGNNDGIQDSRQSQVFSIPDMTGRYITVMTDIFYIFDTVSVNNLSDFPVPPEGTSLEGGVIKFRLSGLPAAGGATSSIGLILPADTAPTEVYGFGATPDDTNPHWYSLAEYIGIIKNASMISPTGTTVKRNLVMMSIVDGGIGDADLAGNGEISLAIAIETRPASGDSSSGSINQAVLLVLWLALVASRSLSRHRKRV